MKASQLQAIKSALAKGDIEPARLALETTADPKDLQQFVEQKLLIDTVNFGPLSAAFSAAADRLLGSPDRQAMAGYVAFAGVYLQATAAIEQQVKTLLEFIFDRSLLEVTTLLYLMDQLFTSGLSKHFKQGTAAAEKQALALQVEAGEWEQFAQMGASADQRFAQLKILSWYTQWRILPAREDFADLRTEEDIDRLARSLLLAGQYNSYDHALAKLTYGEWRVTHADLSALPVFTFAIADESLELARQIGLKRALAAKMMGRQYPFELQKKLESVVDKAVAFALDYYEQAARDMPRKFKREVAAMAKWHLQGIELADKLLAEHATTNEVFGQYVAATVLFTFYHVADALKAHPVYKNLFINPELPVAAVKELLADIYIDGEAVAVPVEPFFSGPLIRNYFSLYTAPFLRDTDGTVFCLEALSGSSPENWVRQLFMKGGGIADKVGKVWEDYLSQVLTTAFDCQVKTGVKLKQGGQLLTDIDVLAIRGNILLIIQIKAYYGMGLNHFEQWKFRNKLIHGAGQANKALEAFKTDPQLLKKVFGPLDVSSVDTLQPLVLTNEAIFNNWSVDQVPVLSVGALNQMINGATVNYVDGKGKVKGRQQLIKGSKISSEELLRFLRSPLDWQLSRGQLELSVHDEYFEHCTLRFPFFDHTVGLKRPTTTR